MVFIKGTLNADGYIKLLKDNKIFDLCRERFGEDFIFQQDGAPCHSTDDVLAWIQITQQVRLLFGWPPNSPDLSPIEILWGAIKLRIYRYPEFPKTEAELKDAIKREWASFDMESINSLILSFRYRLLMCKDVGGQSISHLISARLHEVPEEYLVPEDERPPLFNEEDDAKMINEFKKIGRKWKKISMIMDNQYEPVMIKYRVLFLNTMQTISARMNSQDARPSTENEEEECRNEETSEITEMISFKTFMIKYCSHMEKRRTMTVGSVDDAEKNERRSKITFRFENPDELSSIPKNETILYASDDLSLTTDDSDDISK